MFKQIDNLVGVAINRALLAKAAIGGVLIGVGLVALVINPAVYQPSFFVVSGIIGMIGGVGLFSEKILTTGPESLLSQLSNVEMAKLEQWSTQNSADAKVVKLEQWPDWYEVAMRIQADMSVSHEVTKALIAKLSKRSGT